ncbi:MAG: bifunctional methylenetetrahydrofolate dehydrogenase/methenyltetrahydrofolate cyclohydrolase FolD [Selenomonas sp.]|uniref:bifunctional methylenetetrahydrofolate dehydrogenase/methenyltetrahydrofolate cyclohydrolase FolD n=1 Tax=Selenomonas sp. TaxID=2053611 RepID=UPI0025E00B54|nr:bifunctional methylenetetrahydrofolate dehydrogenase/methenyltetrahydrofolate cyclohydrolase FolD [Selenomonas sp.]MCR5757800.1 bifunctional methylenetetrahydrofolate dehydrogenase/methenyltetrahydrofolate cyclohydrolase FolD [Selenomonas sp.]
MSAKILEGKFFAQQLKEDAGRRAAALQEKYGRAPGLAVIRVGSDPASEVYVRNKDKACAALGIYSEVIALPEETTKEELLTRIDALNDDTRIDGILVQLPLPAQIAQFEGEILNRIDPSKDVDGFHPVNVGKMVTGEPALLPCTPAGCIRMLEMAGIEIAGKRAVVIGRSNIVGKPMFHLLMAKNATVTVCHSRTENLADITRQADILVAAIGKPQFVKQNMVKPGATVIDVGINRIAPKKLVGDVDFGLVSEIAGAITPVPGGVGLLTVAMLMQNVVQAAEAHLNR